jgi:type I restriction enzyme M protein
MSCAATTNDKKEYLPIDRVLVELAGVEEEHREIDNQLYEIFQKLGFEGY